MLSPDLPKRSRCLDGRSKTHSSASLQPPRCARSKKQNAYEPPRNELMAAVCLKKPAAKSARRPRMSRTRLCDVRNRHYCYAVVDAVQSTEGAMKVLFLATVACLVLSLASSA